MKKLNDLLEVGACHFWCSSTGEMSEPSMPEEATDLFNHYWTDRYSCSMRVADFEGVTGMAMAYLYDRDYCARMHNKSEATENDMREFYEDICKTAAIMAQEKELHGCSIYVGENTDPDGHEMVVFVPYEKREHIIDIADFFEKG